MRRPRLLVVLLATLTLLLFPVAPATAEDSYVPAGVMIDGIRLDAEAYIVNGRTMVPMRAIFERLGADVSWDQPTQTVTAVKGKTIIKLPYGSTTATVDGREVTLAVPAIAINGRTFVPLRFVAEALGAEVSWDQANFAAVVKTNSGCSLPGGQRHEGTIKPGGETWGLCGSPHIVSGEFMVEGADSPVLVIEAGALVQFEKNAGLYIGTNNPGGLEIKGTASSPVTLTAATAGPQPGFWRGISFGTQTIKGQALIQNARVQYAGGTDWNRGAITLDGDEQLVEVLLKDVAVTNSQFAGLNMWGNARLDSGSANLKISGTKMVGTEGGFPIITGAVGSHNLPLGEYKENDLNGVNIWSGVHYDTISSNTTWRNLGIPYASSVTIDVEGNASPTLTIEPGVITLWAADTALRVGYNGPGTLVADAKARPEGGGEWRTAHEAAMALATAKSLEPGCALCASNRGIVFGAWNADTNRGFWDGIIFGNKSGNKSKLVGALVAYAGKDSDYRAGIYADGGNNDAVRILVQDSMVTGAIRSGLEFFGNVELLPGSTGNTFTGNGWPVRMQPDSVGSLQAGNSFKGNDNDWISVWDSSNWGALTRTATWRNLDVPFYMELELWVGGTARPVLTIEPGSSLVFAQDMSMKIGDDGIGSLVAVGTAAKPIRFVSDLGRAGSWSGLSFGDSAGQGNRLEYAIIEHAQIGVSVSSDLGGFIKNTTIRSSSEMAIYRGYGTDGTSFLLGLGNQFEGNAVDENEE